MGLTFAKIALRTTAWQAVSEIRFSVKQDPGASYMSKPSGFDYRKNNEVNPHSQGLGKNGFSFEQSKNAYNYSSELKQKQTQKPGSKMNALDYVTQKASDILAPNKNKDGSLKTPEVLRREQLDTLYLNDNFFIKGTKDELNAIHKNFKDRNLSHNSQRGLETLLSDNNPNTTALEHIHKQLQTEIARIEQDYRRIDTTLKPTIHDLESVADQTSPSPNDHLAWQDQIKDMSDQAKELSKQLSAQKKEYERFAQRIAEKLGSQTEAAPLQNLHKNRDATKSLEGKRQEKSRERAQYSWELTNWIEHTQGYLKFSNLENCLSTIQEAKYGIASNLKDIERDINDNLGVPGKWLDKLHKHEDYYRSLKERYDSFEKEVQKELNKKGQDSKYGRSYSSDRYNTHESGNDSGYESSGEINNRYDQSNKKTEYSEQTDLDTKIHKNIQERYKIYKKAEHDFNKLLKAYNDTVRQGKDPSYLLGNVESQYNKFWPHTINIYTEAENYRTQARSSSWPPQLQEQRKIYEKLEDQMRTIKNEIQYPELYPRKTHRLEYTTIRQSYKSDRKGTDNISRQQNTAARQAYDANYRNTPQQQRTLRSDINRSNIDALKDQLKISHRELNSPENKQFINAHTQFLGAYNSLERTSKALDTAKQNGNTAEIAKLEDKFSLYHRAFHESRDTMNKEMSKKKIFTDDKRYEEHKSAEILLSQQAEYLTAKMSERTQKKIELFKEERFNERSTFLKNVYQYKEKIINNWDKIKKDSNKLKKEWQWAKITKQECRDKLVSIDTDLSASANNQRWWDNLNQQKQSYLDLASDLDTFEDNLADFQKQATSKPLYKAFDDTLRREINIEA